MTHRTKPYTSDHMTHRARSLRRNAPTPERILWGLLRARRLRGLKFRRQVPVGSYVADYLCEDVGLVVELDGMTHDGRGEEDAHRTANLEQRGLRVLRVTSDDLLKHPDAVAALILKSALTPALSQGERGKDGKSLSRAGDVRNMNDSRRNFGSAMTETVLSLPLILLILAMLLFFGLNMQRLQRVAVVDRYEAWRQIVDAPGPNTNSALNKVFFGGKAPSLEVRSATGHFTDTQDFLVSQAQLISDQASSWMVSMFDELPGSRQTRARASFEQPVEALSKFTGPIIHHHTVLDGDWRYAPWAEWRHDVDTQLSVVDYWPALRDEFIMTLEDRLQPLDSSGNELAGILRDCYLASEPYRGPGDADYWPKP